MTQTFEIPEARLVALQNRANKVGLRAKRAGLPVPTLKVLGTKASTINAFDALAKVRGHASNTRQVGIMLATVEVDGCEPRVGEWNIVGYRYGQTDRQGAYHTFESGIVPPEKHGADLCCDHCGLKRKRSQTLIVSHAEEDRTLEVGKSCLADFTGLHFNETFLNTIFDSGLFLAEIEKASNWSFTDGGLDLGEEVRSILAIASSIVREEGYRNAATADLQGMPSTMALVSAEMHRLNNPEIDQSTVLVMLTDFEEADRIIAHFSARTVDHPFFNKVADTIARGLGGPRDIAILSAAAGTYQKFVEKEALRQASSGVVNSSSDVGELNKPVTFQATVADIRNVDSDWGSFTVIEMIDSRDNLLVWKTNSEHGLEKGHRYELKGTVKAHGVARFGPFKGAAETQMKRLTVKERFGPAIAPAADLVTENAADELDSIFGV